jgi:hypothetical protein
VTKPVSKFAFQVHNLRRYNEGAMAWADAVLVTAVGLCTLESS